MFVCSVVHTLAAHSSACAVSGEVRFGTGCLWRGTYRQRVMWKRLLGLGLAVLVPVAIVAISSPRLSIADSPAVLTTDPATARRGTPQAIAHSLSQASPRSRWAQGAF